MANYQDPRKRPRKSKYAKLDRTDGAGGRFNQNPAQQLGNAGVRRDLSGSLPPIDPRRETDARLADVPEVGTGRSQTGRQPLASGNIPRVSARGTSGTLRPVRDLDALPQIEPEASRRSVNGKHSPDAGSTGAHRRRPAGKHAHQAGGRASRNLNTIPDIDPRVESVRASRAENARRSADASRPERGERPARHTGNTGRVGGSDPSSTGAVAAEAASKAAAAATGAIATVGSAAGHGAKNLFSWLFQRMRESRRFAGVVIAICALLVLGIVDLGMNAGKIYGNVSVGQVDVSGMTQEEAAKALEETYATRVSGHKVTIYANQEVMDKANAGEDIQNFQASEDMSVEEAAARTSVWTADANKLQARMEYKALAKKAYELGREDGGIPERLHLLFFGDNLQATVSLNESALEKIAKSIDRTLGNPRKNFSIKVANGTASVVKGHDGNEVDRNWLRDQIQQRFTSDDESDQASSFVAQIDYAPLQITKEMAQQVADQVNTAIGNGATFSFEGKDWHADNVQVGKWVKAKSEEESGNWRLVPYLNKDKAKSTVLKHVQAKFDSEDAKVEFNKDEGGGVTVHTSAEGNMPVISKALDQLEQDFFGEGDHSQAPTINVESMPIPDSMSVQAALDYGIISVVSSYTTEYTADADERNHNIHLAADLLNNSIIKAEGGEWSFHGTAGECNKEKGFQGAGVIIGGETVDEIGGGICQVATTVFNAVFEGGFEVVNRRNHSLYIASYPDGRDAAVSWPDLDLVWANDSKNDLLMRTSYTDTTVTVSLLGVSDGRKVTSSTGAWKKGKSYTTITKKDSSQPRGYVYIKQNGTDGGSITVVRTVKSASGKVLHKDTFSSVYDARDEIIVKGTAG